MACHPRASCHIAGYCHLANSMSWSQSYVSHCRVLPLGEFTVMIPEPHATLQGAVTWRNQCHDCVTLQGVIISSAISKIVFCHFLLFFLFLMQFGVWQAAAFVSSPIHLFVMCSLFHLHFRLFPRLIQSTINLCWDWTSRLETEVRWTHLAVTSREKKEC